MIQSLLSEASKLILFKPCSVSFVVFMQNHILIREPWSLTSNGESQFGEGVAVSCLVGSILIKEILSKSHPLVSQNTVTTTLPAGVIFKKIPYR